MQEIKGLLNKGEILVTSSNKKTIIIYNNYTIYLCDLEKQKVNAVLNLDKKDVDQVVKLIISKDNHSLIVWTWTGHSGSLISTYNIQSSLNGNKTLVCTQKIKTTPGEYVAEVEIIPNTNLIAIRYMGGQNSKHKIQIVNPKTNRYLRSFSVPACSFMRFFANEIMMTASTYRINIWDLKTKSEDPIHSIENKDRILKVIKISDKQCMVQEKESIKIYNFDSLKCIKTIPLMQNSFYNLDNRYFISAAYSFSGKMAELELNLWELSDNDFKRLPNQDFQLKIKLIHTYNHTMGNEISFIPVQTDEGNWICVIKDQSITPMNIPTNNDFISTNKFCKS